MYTVKTRPTPNEQLAELRAVGWKTQKHFAKDYGMTSNELGSWLKSKGWKLTKGMLSEEARNGEFAVNGAQSEYGLNPLWNVEKIHPYLEQDGYMFLSDKQERRMTRIILTFIASWNNKSGRAMRYEDINLPDIQTIKTIDNITFMSSSSPFTLHTKFETTAELKACIDTFDEMLSQRPDILSHLGHRDLLDKYIAICRDQAYTNKQEGNNL